jgi:hypothetical protein
VAADDPISTELRAVYGVRPRRYGGLLDRTNDAERRFLATLPQVTAFVNDVCARRGQPFRVTEAELAINFISEGGFYLLDEDIVDDIDGYTYLGIDTLVDNLQALRPWLHGSITAAVAAGDRTVERTNELGQAVHTLRGLTIEEGLYANSGMYAWSKALSERDIAASGRALVDLAAPAHFFWASYYYNAGVGAGHRKMHDKGVDFYAQRWTRADDAMLFGRNAQFNALWRTASLHYFLRTICPDGACTTQAPAARTYASADPAAEIPDGDAAGILSSLWVGDAGTLAGLRVRIDIEHPYPGDLFVELLHGGRTAALYDASKVYSAGELAVPDFDGLDIGGWWDLVVVDGAPVDVGTLRGWSITTTVSTPAQ